VTLEKFKWLVRSIFIVQEEEMLCSDFFEILPLYVHLQLAGKEVEKLFPKRPPSPSMPRMQRSLSGPS